MIILLEGPNGSGKSTLAEELQAQLGFDRTWVGSRLAPQGEVLPWYTAPVAFYEPGRDEHVVGDRWHLSERVYGPLLRNHFAIAPIEWAAMEAMFNRLGAVQVICKATLVALSARTEARGETTYADADSDVELSATMLHREITGYQQAVTWSTIKTVTAPTDGSFTPTQVAKSVIKLARKAEEEAVEALLP